MKKITKLEGVGSPIRKAKKLPVTIRFCVVKEGCYIKTKEGTMFASIGSVVIEGIEGEIYPCAKKIFEATYKEVSD